MKRIIALGNSSGSTEGRSGGESRFSEIFKRMRGFKRYIITSRIGKEVFEHFNLDAEYLITTNEAKVRNIPFTYVARTIKALLLRPAIQDKDILYSTSDFLPDVLPPFLWQLRKREQP